MRYPRTALAAVVVALLCLFPLTAIAQSTGGSSDLKDGIEQFRLGQYDKAILLFHNVILDPSANAQKPAACLLIAKSYMAIGKLSEAEQNLEFYLANYTGSKEYEEALYQKGRLLFMQVDFESSIQVLQSFIASYPKSSLIPSAWFWAGECLYSLGRLDDALAVYQKIITEHPSSVKTEASQYKVSLIQLRKKEVELAKLLKWSHEDFLKSMEEYQNREKAYEQAIQSYQKRLSASTAEEDRKTIAALQKDLARKNEEVKQLQAQIEKLLASASASPSSPTNTTPSTPMIQEEGTATAEQPDQKALLQRLAAARQTALGLKEKYLAWLAAHGEDGK